MALRTGLVSRIALQARFNARGIFRHPTVVGDLVVLQFR
jgi:hypothetical protein